MNDPAPTERPDPMRHGGRWLRWCVWGWLLFVLLSASGCAWLDARERQLIYRPTPGGAQVQGWRAGDERYFVDLPPAAAQTGEATGAMTQRVEMWWLPNADPGAPTLLYFHGTVNNLAQNLPKMEALRAARGGLRRAGGGLPGLGPEHADDTIRAQHPAGRGPGLGGAPAPRTARRATRHLRSFHGQRGGGRSGQPPARAERLRGADPGVGVHQFRWGGAGRRMVGRLARALQPRALCLAGQDPPGACPAAHAPRQCRRHHPPASGAATLRGCPSAQGMGADRRWWARRPAADRPGAISEGTAQLPGAIRREPLQAGCDSWLRATSPAAGSGRPSRHRPPWGRIRVPRKASSTASRRSSARSRRSSMPWANAALRLAPACRFKT